MNKLHFLSGWLALGAAVAVQAAQPLGCLIEAERSADLGSQVVGIIDHIAVERGDVVKKGQVLAVLKAQPERAAVALAKIRQEAEGEVRAAEAAVRFAEQTLTRNENLFERNFVSRHAVDQARTDADVARQKLAQARDNHRAASSEVTVSQAQLNQRSIVAPFDGVVTERYMVAGERVEEKPILRVAQVDPLRVQVVVPVSLYGQIKPGDSALVKPELPGTGPVTAQVNRVDKVIDPASNTFRTLLRLENKTLSLPAGLRCTVEFTASASAVAPEAAKAVPAQTAKPPLASTQGSPQVAPAKPTPSAAAPASLPPKAASAERATPAAEPLSEAVRTQLLEWRRAWAKRNSDTYLSYYAQDFQPPRGLTREAWMTERRSRLAVDDTIYLRLEDIDVSEAAPGTLRTRFTQHYRMGNFSDVAHKELLWRKRGGVWLIVQESQLP